MPNNPSSLFERSHYYRPKSSGLTPQQTRDNFKRAMYVGSFFIPMGLGAKVGWRLGKAAQTFHRRGGVHVSSRLVRSGVRKTRGTAARIRRPIRTSRTYRRIDRKLPFYRTRVAYRAGTDLAKDAAWVGGATYYGGKRIQSAYRRLGASTSSSPTRTAFSQTSMPSNRGPAGPKKRRRGRTSPSRCPPGHYYSRKYRRCVRSKF